MNKLSTKCEARLQLSSCSWPEGVVARLRTKATSGGAVVSVSDRHCTQSANRKDALEKLAALVEEAWRPPKVRRQYQGLSKAGKRARVDAKKKLSAKKQSRSAGKRGAFDAAVVPSLRALGRRDSLMASLAAFAAFGRGPRRHGAALAAECDDACKQRIVDRRALFEQSRTTSDRQKILDLSRQRAVMYNTTFQGASCIPGLPCY